MKIRSLAILVVGFIVTALTSPALAVHHPGMGRFLQRDPNGMRMGPVLDAEALPSALPRDRFIARDKPATHVQYMDGMNLSQYERSNSIRRLDPTGLYTLKQVRVSHCDDKYKHIIDPFVRGDSIIACADALKGTQDNFDLWYEEEKKDMSWMANLPDCPCKLTCSVDPDIHNPNPKVWDDPHEPTNVKKYHPAGVWEIRTITANAHGAGQQCIYDKAGDLITEVYGAGTADRKQASKKAGTVFYWVVEAGHIGHDVFPFDLAYKLDGDTHGPNVDKYIEVRPTNNGGKCPKNP